MNIGLFGKGHASAVEPLAEQIRAGAVGLKVHEDWGSTTSSIDMSLRVADEYDVQVAIHTDTLNECGFVEDTIRAIDGRVIHTFHTEGAGGGHAPDIIKIAGTAQRPARLHQPHAAVHPQHHRRAPGHAHGLPPPQPGHPRRRGLRRLPHPRRNHRRRGRPARPRHLRHHLLRLPGHGPGGRSGHPHLAGSRRHETAARRARRIRTGELAHGMQRRNPTTSASNATWPNTPSTPPSPRAWQTSIGSVEEGKFADLVLWDPAFFGVKPELVIKGGQIAYALMGDANASIPTPQPRTMRPMFATYGKALQQTSITFLSQAAIDAGVPAELGLETHHQTRLRHPQPHQSGPQIQRRNPGHRRRPRNLQGDGRRRRSHLRALRRAAHGPALLPLLTRRTT